MAVSTVSAGLNPYLQGASGQPASTTTATANADASATSSTPAANATADTASVKVTLSPEAKVLATLASRGITTTQVNLANLNLPALPNLQQDPAAFAAYFHKINKASVSPPTDGNGHPDGQISQSAFEKVVKQFNGTQTLADQLFAALDTNHNQSLSHAEVLQALTSTLTDSNGKTAQSLMTLMDQGGNGPVSESSFAAFETALVAAEKPGAAST